MIKSYFPVGNMPPTVFPGKQIQPLQECEVHLFTGILSQLLAQAIKIPVPTRVNLPDFTVKWRLYSVLFQTRNVCNTKNIVKYCGWQLPR